MARETLTWYDIDVDSLSPALADAHAAMVAAKMEFESRMRAALRTAGRMTNGQSAIFSYKRGGLAYAVVSEREATTRTKIVI